ncbi:hypothetical protein Q5741_19335 [Paenibacillus sp. JX-17]|uniref:Lipoprotein n=1 Tax=Paenibacillus lacisoli TaxID=3064525 RepID=A0ABT9CI50_9BACL|nr:hypothetical protein [Paenibacillus sp. JX-17]MDO7908545.1 hypothetical protein [Paenibacillus sp. JX-17]
MQRLKWLFPGFLLCMIMLILAGCSDTKPSWTSFEGALNEKNFPVPKEANKTDRTADNPEMDYVRYALPGIKENQDIPEVYLNEIAAWGWTEETKQSTPSKRVFIKDRKMVQLSVHDGFFTILVPKQQKAAADTSLDIN